MVHFVVGSTQTLLLLSTDRWYGMMSVKDFIIEILAGCSSQEVREVAYQQFTNLINMTTPTELNPKKFLTQVQHFSV